jgi:hypothetical protein
MRRVFGILTACLLSLFGVASAQAAMSVRVDIPAQRMHVTTSDGEVYNWVISSGRKGFRSPNGVFRPTRLEKNWYSRKYGGAMPYAVFFRGGYAIHGTTAVGALGRPASHGCIRLHTANARTFFALVKKHGHGGTRIALHGAAPDGLSQFAKASTAARAKLAVAKPARPVASSVRTADTRLAAVPAVATTSKASIAKPKVAANKVASTMITATKFSTTQSAGAKFATATPAKSKLAKSTPAKSKLAKAALAKAKAVAQNRKAPNWSTAREQILLRPSLPHGALGFQPDELRRYRETGPRWPSP